MPIPTRNLPVGTISSFSGSALAGAVNIIDAPRTRPAMRGKDRLDIAYFLPSFVVSHRAFARARLRNCRVDRAVNLLADSSAKLRSGRSAPISQHSRRVGRIHHRIPINARNVLFSSALLPSSDG